MNCWSWRRYCRWEIRVSFSMAEAYRYPWWINFSVIEFSNWPISQRKEASNSLKEIKEIWMNSPFPNSKWFKRQFQRIKHWVIWRRGWLTYQGQNQMMQMKTMNWIICLPGWSDLASLDFSSCKRPQSKSLTLSWPRSLTKLTMRVTGLT